MVFYGCNVILCHSDYICKSCFLPELGCPPVWHAEARCARLWVLHSLPKPDLILRDQKVVALIIRGVLFTAVSVCWDIHVSGRIAAEMSGQQR
jgi:hypothetical protein